MRKIYDETLGALANQFHILAAIGIRSLLELTTQTLGATKGTLQSRIDQLVKSGSITKESSDLLHLTRLLGNVAVHEVTPIPVGELSSALDIVENLLQSTFIVPNAARQLAKKYQAIPKATNGTKKKASNNKK
ncbi:DUF4145 domain-containing protein [Leptospira wolffii]|nr:DUF4145 domain-containing protein [Leptospira wolffii]